MRVALLTPPVPEKGRSIVRDLLFGCWCKGRRVANTQAPPLSELYVATVLQESGHQVTLIDAAGEGKSIEQVIKTLAKLGAELVVLNSATMSWRDDADACRQIKREIDMKTIFFGQHPTFFPCHALQNDAVDFIIQYEPEYAARDLVNTLEDDGHVGDVKGIGYKANGKLRVNPPQPWIELDELPIPDRSLLPAMEYFNPLVLNTPYTTALTSRGCHFRCIFCTDPYFYGRSYRYRSAEKVVYEMEQIAKMGYKEIWYRDETFTMVPKRVEEMCELKRKAGNDLTWFANGRIPLSRGLMSTMLGAGCHTLKFGVESGVQHILDGLKKDIKIEWTEKTFKYAHEIGMRTHAHVMLGCPGENGGTLKQTIRFIKKMAPDSVTFGICTPYPGSALFDMVKSRDPTIGDGTDLSLKWVHLRGFYNQYYTALTEQELEGAVRDAYRQFYFRLSYVLGSLREVRSSEHLKRLVRAGLTLLLFGLVGD